MCIYHLNGIQKSKNDWDGSAIEKQNKIEDKSKYRLLYCVYISLSIYGTPPKMQQCYCDMCQLKPVGHAVIHTKE